VPFLLQVRDPYSAITRCSTDRSIACGSDLTRCPTERIFFMDAIQVARQTQHRIEDAWKAIRTANLPENRGARISPIDSTISLLHGDLQTTFDIVATIIQGFWYRGATLNFCDRF
jgi:hypothetical protein